MSTIIEDVKKLPISLRIQLVEDIWDSIAAESPASLSLTDTERDELHRRKDAHKDDPSSSIPWEKIRSKLFNEKT